MGNQLEQLNQRENKLPAAAAVGGNGALCPVSLEQRDESQRHLSTNHLLGNLRQRTISSGMVTIASQGAQFVLSLGSIMILARMLAPRDFGLLAMVSTVLSFLRIFKEAGLSTATVQREGITHAQVSNLFWVNCSLSAFITVLVAASAPAIAWFYREPELAWITVALSFTFVLEGMAVQHLAILNRQMRFVTRAAIQIGSTIMGVAAAIAMAWKGCEYWSLVGLQLTTTAFALLFTWGSSSWRPQLPSRNRGTRSLVSFGANMAVSSFVYSLSRGVDSLLIGRIFGSASLGLYSRAAVLLNRPLEQLITPIETVFLPIFSRILPEPERYRRTVLKVYETVALAGFFLTGLIFALAHPITLAVLGPKWDAAAPIFAGFTIGAVFLPLFSASTWLFASQARGRDSLVTSIIVSCTTVCAMLAGLPFGPTGVALAYSLCGLFVLLPIMYYFAGRKGPVTTADLWVASLKQSPVWAITSGGAYCALSFSGGLRPVWQLAICVPLATAAGTAFIFGYPPSRAVAQYLILNLRRNQMGPE